MPDLPGKKTAYYGFTGPIEPGSVTRIAAAFKFSGKQWLRRNLSMFQLHRRIRCRWDISVQPHPVASDKCNHSQCRQRRIDCDSHICGRQ